MRIPTIAIKVDILGCPHVNEVASDMCLLANKLGVSVETEFNGVAMIAYPGSAVKEVVAAWDRLAEIFREREK